MLDADVERKLLLTEAAELEAVEEMSSGQQHRQGEVLAQLELIAAETAPRRGMELLTSLGFSEEMKGRKLGDMSGGWRVRTMLAAAIFARPDMLLLDEPTNHLSILAVMWLSRELATNPVWAERIVVVVSHDRFFIDEVCTHCLHISGVAKRLTQSQGNYTMWAERRREMQAVFAKQQELRQEKIDTLKEFAGHGFRYGGSTSQINMVSLNSLCDSVSLRPLAMPLLAHSLCHCAHSACHWTTHYVTGPLTTSLTTLSLTDSNFALLYLHATVRTLHSSFHSLHTSL